MAHYILVYYINMTDKLGTKQVIQGSELLDPLGLFTAEE
uniref:Uncharacterized protein n=1 Tax=Arundo donax TaxID=35708 RepID=A0A0A9ATM3_ARUDO